MRAGLWPVLVLVAVLDAACAREVAREVPASLVRVPVGVASIAAGPAGVLTAAELGLFAARDLDVAFTPFSSATLCVSAMLSGQIPICVGVAGVVVINAVLAGAEIRGIAALVDTMPYSLVVSAHIATPRDLAGKRIGINRPGASAEYALRFALARLGIDPGDVVFVTIGEQPQRLAALQAGSIDGTLIAPPGALAALKAGFRSLLDLHRLGLPYPHNLVVATNEFVRARPDAARRFVEAVAEGTYRFKSDRALGIRVLAPHLGVKDPEDLDGTYTLFSETLADPPLVAPDGMQALLSALAETNPALIGARPDDFLDMRVVRELQANGTLDRLRARVARHPSAGR
jgi:NitT/TauT family transport system substrate-binding protein